MLTQTWVGSRYRRCGQGAFMLGLLVISTAARADLTIVLKNDFIERFKNRAMITVPFTVDKPSKVHPAKDDGDIHIAGRAPEVGLPLVAEIMNASAESAALQAVKTAKTSGAPVEVTGAWRLWCEHGGMEDQVQGAPVDVPEDSNPPHVFEIHPVTDFDGHSVAKALHPIQGYDPKDAHDAFVKYEGTRSAITSTGDTTSIRTVMAGFNYVEFIMELNEDPTHETDEHDGRSVFASVFDTDCELLLHKRRMVFLKDTPPERKVKTLKRGDQLHVLGMPRIDLALVSWRTTCAKDDDCRTKHPDVLNWSLPYEILIVGVYGPSSCETP